MHLSTPVADVSPGMKRFAKRLEKLNIRTILDLLYHLPSRYQDFSLTSSIGSIQEGEVVTVKGQVIEAKNDYTRRFKTVQKVVLADETGSVVLTWFNQPYIIKSLENNTKLSVSGRIEKFSGKLTMISPDYEVIGDDLIHTGRIIPIYPETYGVSSKWLRRQIYSVLNQISSEITEYLPLSLLKSYDLLPLEIALREIHFPESIESSQKARERLAFEELLLLQLASIERKRQWSLESNGVLFKSFEEKLQQFYKSLPFTLTNSQQLAIQDIINDTKSGKPMNRLIQGDVGSGKTIIAAVSLYLSYLNGYQGALMAPTEILAGQHYQTISSLLEPLGVKIGFATSSTKIGIKDENSSFDIMVGTHALVGKKVNFTKLGMVVIDEQQRFGVEQRGILREKGTHPHLITMTATPIPRTVALTMYGDLALTYLTDMPKGRKIIKTWLVPDEKRQGSYGWIRREIQENDSQIFIICPFIEESENNLTIKAATKEFDRLRTEIFPDLSLGLLHGKMKAKEKDQVLLDFKNRQYDILVATPVVEVGIDVANATVIVIEGAERFGLAQLHQLRGRVGRGDKQSYCLLFTESKTENSITRLKAMETMKSGAELAEYDLTLRGPGEMYGLRQSGVRLLKIAKFSDTELLDKAKRAAIQLFPLLTTNPVLAEKINPLLSQKVSPD